MSPSTNTQSGSIDKTNPCTETTNIIKTTTPFMSNSHFKKIQSMFNKYYQIFEAMFALSEKQHE